MPIEKRGDFNLDRLSKRFKIVKSGLPSTLGNMGKNHFLKGFRTNGGQTDAGKWVPRWKRLGKNRVSRTQKEPSNLIKTGALRRSISLGRSTGFTSSKVSMISIRSIGIRYARSHNDGLSPQPKREFLGRSKVLEKNMERRIKKEIDSIFK